MILVTGDVVLDHNICALQIHRAATFAGPAYQQCCAVPPPSPAARKTVVSALCQRESRWMASSSSPFK